MPLVYSFPSMSEVVSAQYTSDAIFLRLAAGEVPPCAGLWVVEYRQAGKRLDGWLGQLDWWSGGILGRAGSQLCIGGRTELFMGMDWMLSDGLLIVPGTDDPFQWAMQSVGKAVELGVGSIQIGLNGMGLNENPVIRNAILSQFRSPAGTKVTFWVGGLFDPLQDGY